jgi:hypothetical protein
MTAKCLLVASLSLCSGRALAQSGDESAAVIEIGVAPSRSITGEGPSLGPSVALEVTPIENRLELEMGATTLFGRHSTEWDFDFLFKKPWTLTNKVEFMFGVGPEWIHMRKSGMTTNSLAGEAVLDFMFWSSTKHRYGWYLEPGYEYSFRAGHEQSIGMTVGLLISIP